MIIAVDFDGVLCKNDFPNIGEPNYEVVSLIRQLIDMKHEVVLWTSRTGEALTEAISWCTNRGLHFCAVNENAPSNLEAYKKQYPQGTRKVYADVYIDDHNLEYSSYSDEVRVTKITAHLRKGVQRWKIEEN